MLCGSRAFGSGFLAIALVEAIDTSCGINQFLFSGKERVTRRTNFDVQVTFLGGASLEGLAARAGDGDIDVFWVNSWFHVITLYGRHAGRDFKRDMIGGRDGDRQVCSGFLTQRRGGAAWKTP